MSALMASAMGGQALTSLSSAYAQGRALKAQGNYQRTVADDNAAFAGASADNAIARGTINANSVKKRAQVMVGSQRAALGAQGIEVNDGSAADVQKDTVAMSAVDATMIKNNAAAEALGYKIQALNYTSRGQFASMAGDNAANNTFLTGGINAVTSGSAAAYWGTRK